jgi:D-xylose transport system ATP-binding protein
MNEAQSPRAAAPERSSTNGPLLALKGISKSFGAVEALKEVDLELRPGEVVGLVGDNGAGKSTLIKAIAGVQPADDGEALFEGNPVTLTSPQAATRLGIATVYQDLALCENLDVVENLYLGQEVDRPVPGVHLLDEPAMERRTLELLDSLGVTTIGSVRTDVAQLSGGQRQAVAIARSLLGEPKLVLLDEPTAALGIVQTREILNLVERLKERGLGVVVISHNLANVFEVADRIVVLRLGRAVASLDADETRREDVVGAITGAEFGDPGGERTTEGKQL